MADEHRDALAEFMRIFDERMEAKPLVDRRKAPASEIVTARRTKGPVNVDFAYWVSREREKRQ